MRMELIQPFINAADAVLADSLHCPTSIGHFSMEEQAYQLRGVAALIRVSGDIEGRIIFDVDPQTAMRVASRMAGQDLPESEDLMRETVCELANQVIGNAITSLNDQGFRFRVHPPEVHLCEHGDKSSEDTEALVMCIETSNGKVFMNVAMRYNSYRPKERAAPVSQ